MGFEFSLARVPTGSTGQLGAGPRGQASPGKDSQEGI